MRKDQQISVYVFRDPHFAPAGDTIVCVAPVDAVAHAYGGGGVHDSDGLSKAFRGAVFFRNEKTGSSHLGVWGARKTTKFREALRQSGLELKIIETPPPGRLVWYATRR